MGGFVTHDNALMLTQSNRSDRGRGHTELAKVDLGSSLPLERPKAVDRHSSSESSGRSTGIRIDAQLEPIFAKDVDHSVKIKTAADYRPVAELLADGMKSSPTLPGSDNARVEHLGRYACVPLPLGIQIETQDRGMVEEPFAISRIHRREVGLKSLERFRLSPGRPAGQGVASSIESSCQSSNRSGRVTSGGHQSLTIGNTALDLSAPLRHRFAEGARRLGFQVQPGLALQESSIPGREHDFEIVDHVVGLNANAQRDRVATCEIQSWHRSARRGMSHKPRRHAGAELAAVFVG